MSWRRPILTDDPSGLEGLCDLAAQDGFHTSTASSGLERIEAFFAGRGYDPHRHDSYAIGLTLSGVQTTDYRGQTTHSRPGQVIVLHPDERHDGRAGTQEGFRYRMLYIQPGDVQRALAGRARALPFVRDGLTTDLRLVDPVRFALWDLARDPEPLEYDQMIQGMAEGLLALDPTAQGKSRSPIAERAVRTARELLDAQFLEGVTSGALENAAGVDRFALARHFRAQLGTSPYRYLVMRRLDHARNLMRMETAILANVALESGFADQSHFSRHFKLAYGVTPGRWKSLHGELHPTR